MYEEEAGKYRAQEMCEQGDGSRLSFATPFFPVPDNEAIQFSVAVKHYESRRQIYTGPQEL